MMKVDSIVLWIKVGITNDSWDESFHIQPRDTWGGNTFYEISEVSDKLRYLTFLSINMLSIHLTDFNYLIWLNCNL